MNANVDLTGVVLETDRLIIREWNEMVMSIFRKRQIRMCSEIFRVFL